MKHWCVWVWFTAGLFMACSSENQWLDTALNLAGDNRAELQKVLDRYKEEDGDKYRAACFLIENMPFHGAYEGKALENYRKYFSEYVSFPYSRHVQELIDSLKRADGEFSINQLTYKRDIMTVDSAFLVNHIEWAFKVWREQPWGKHVDFDTFCKSDFRVVKVEACEAVPKSKKLLRFTLNDGSDKKRTILSGIREFYEPEELVGKTCVAITNLPPRKMMGIDSEGMLISAVYEYDGKEGLNLLMLDDNIPAGAKLR